MTLSLSTTFVIVKFTRYSALTVAVLFLAVIFCVQFTNAILSNVPLVKTLTSIETTNDSPLVKLPTFQTTV